MYQYHVSFNPEVTSKSLRQGMLKEHKEMLGDTRVFDGMILFMPRRLPQDVSTAAACVATTLGLGVTRTIAMFLVLLQGVGCAVQ